MNFFLIFFGINERVFIIEKVFLSFIDNVVVEIKGIKLVNIFRIIFFVD